MDYEDMSRIMTQLRDQDYELFKSWIEVNYCCDCENQFYNRTKKLK